MSKQHSKIAQAVSTEGLHPFLVGILASTLELHHRYRREEQSEVMDVVVTCNEV